MIISLSSVDARLLGKYKYMVLYACRLNESRVDLFYGLSAFDYTYRLLIVPVSFFLCMSAFDRACRPLSMLIGYSSSAPLFERDGY